MTSYLEGVPIELRIGLYQDWTRHGQVELDTVFVMVPDDYTCEPKDIVTHNEVTQIAKVLRREPDIQAGVVGEFAWCME